MIVKGTQLTQRADLGEGLVGESKVLGRELVRDVVDLVKALDVNVPVKTSGEIADQVAPSPNLADIR